MGRGVVSPHYPGHLFRPGPLSFLEPPFQPSNQDYVSRLHLSVRLGVLDRREHLLYADLCTQLAQLLAGELCVVFEDKTPWYTKAAHNILPYEMQHLVSRDLRHWLGFNPLCEVFDGYYQILHLPYRQREGPQNVDSPRMKGPRAIDGPQLFWWRFVPVGVLLALLASLGVPYAIFHYRRPVKACVYDLRR